MTIARLMLRNVVLVMEWAGRKDSIWEWSMISMGAVEGRVDILYAPGYPNSGTAANIVGITLHKAC